jgi:hypothetical protein
MQFSGVTTTANSSLPSVQIGTSIVLTYTFDSNATDTNALANIGNYALTGFTVTLGGNEFVASPVTNSYVRISNNAGGSYDDFYDVNSSLDPLLGPQINGATLRNAGVDLIDYEAGQFNSDDLILNPDPLSQFERKRFTLDFNLNPGNASIVGVIDSWTVVQATVPIPAAVWLFGSALGILGWMRRKES